MSDKDFGAFDNIDKVEVTGRGQFLRVGQHLLVARSARWKKSLKANKKNWTSEHTVIKSTAWPFAILKPEEKAAGLVVDVSMPAPMGEGTQASWTIDDTKVGFDGRVKGWVLAIKGTLINLNKAGMMADEDMKALSKLWEFNNPENISKAEIVACCTDPMAVAGWPLWANVQRMLTTTNKIIDGVNFQSLSVEDCRRYEKDVFGEVEG